MKTRLSLFLMGLCVCSCTCPRPGPGPAPYCGTVKTKDNFAIVQGNAAAPLWLEAGDFPGVLRAANDLRQDVARVTGRTPPVNCGESAPGANVILIGTIGKNPIIDKMIRDNKLDAAGVAGQWESFVIQVVSKPLPGVARALVIAGSDKRGTIYGIYDLSGQIGVSPWHYWADVPVEHKPALFVKAGPCKQGPPSVKYRGLFLNDEDPDLTQWVREKYGTVPVAGGQSTANYGRGFYTNLFELILRLKGNFLWPAMWNNRFNEDDPENPRLADEYGIVMGTSHQEPMLRAQKEWDWGANYGRIYGNWNYSIARQQPVLQQFWREGVRRNRNFESIFTMGLRAENDSGAPIGKELTGEIVNVQRKILAEEVNADLTKVPQAWCLYKEVQDFYSEGLRPPADITLLWAEDNWGNVRRLPTADERQRPGGAGIYYHFDYHGGPRSYQWINTSPISKIWDQLSLAKQYGADRIWIVNVGHFKGYEFPLEYFMSLAWDSQRWTNNNLNEFTRLWAARQFGPAHAAEISDILAKYSKYNGRRKPELLEPGTYSLEHYQEAERVVADFQAISDKAEIIYHQLPREKRDAFFELVLFPAKASAQLNEMYLAANQNAVYARQGRASANDKAAECRALFQSETNWMADYNHTLAGGKWDHFMDQPFIGYTSWMEPRQGNNLGAIRLKEVPAPDEAEMGLALEGGGDALPRFDAFNQQRHYLEVFNKGKTPFAFTAAASDSWITLSESGGTVEKDHRLWVGVDWGKAPKGTAAGTVRVAGVNTNFTVKVEAVNPVAVTRASLCGFVEGEGVVSIEPEHWTKKIDSGAGRWIKIEDYGRTLSGMRATGPVDAPAATPRKDAPCLEYRMYLWSTGEAEVATITGPTLNFVPGRDLRFALAFDDAPPQTVTLVPGNYSAQNGNRDWETTVKDSARVVKTKFTLARPGYHTLKLWMVDPGVVVEKLVVDLGGLKPSYLGPPESYRRGRKP
ncbi:MAG: glycosyl hydrolase 115 family protein [Verrucomicrobiota bacterium]